VSRRGDQAFATLLTRLGSAGRSPAFRMPCEDPGFRLIQRPIWSGKFELHAHTSRRTVEVAGRWAVYSRVRLAGHDSRCSIGRPVSRPGGNCAGSARLPRTWKQGQIIRSKLASPSSMFIARANVLPLGRPGLRGRQRARRPPPRRAHRVRSWRASAASVPPPERRIYPHGANRTLLVHRFHETASIASWPMHRIVAEMDDNKRHQRSKRGCMFSHNATGESQIIARE
jgi:hypothetical protein